MASATLEQLEVTDSGMNLARETVCVTVSFGLLGNHRKVHTSAVTVDADKDLIHVSKTLLDSPELKAISKADGEMRRKLYDLCLPYDLGIYLLPNKLISTVLKDLREFRAKRAIMVEQFITAYGSLRDDAQVRLRSLYDPSNYPSTEQVRAKFYCEWAFISFGTPESLQGISRELFEEEKRKASAKMQSAAEEITAVMRQTLATLVSHLKDRLTPGEDGKPKILRDTAVTNLQEFLATFNLRNVVNDTELARCADAAKLVLSRNGQGEVNAEFLRNSDSLRQRIASDLDIIKSELDSLVADKPSRKFRPNMED